MGKRKKRLNGFLKQKLDRQIEEKKIGRKICKGVGDTLFGKWNDVVTVVPILCYYHQIKQFTSHGESVQIVVASWQRGVSVITALVVVVLDVEAAQFRVFDAQRAARVVNILSVQRLQQSNRQYYRDHFGQ